MNIYVYTMFLKKITYMLLPCYRPAKLIEFEMKLKLMDLIQVLLIVCTFLPSPALLTVIITLYYQR
jgi:hypothetical protein